MLKLKSINIVLNLNIALNWRAKLKLLVHCCCAPCAVETVEFFKKKNNVSIFFYNPNIHPYKEYEKRLKSLEEFCKKFDLKMFVEDFYGLRHFIKGLNNNFTNRCDFCYEDRLLKTATFAKKSGFDAFSTSLLYSPFQQHEKIKKIAEIIAHKLGILFLYEDLRIFYRTGQKKARELGFYMQKYCGCIFSEQERYLKECY